MGGFNAPLLGGGIGEFTGSETGGSEPGGGFSPPSTMEGGTEGSAPSGNGGNGGGNGGGGAPPPEPTPKIQPARIRSAGIVGRQVASFRFTGNAGAVIQWTPYRVPDNALCEVRPLSTNTGAVFISKNPLVTADSMRITLNPGDNPLFLEAQVLSEWYQTQAVNGEGLEVLVKVRV